MPDKHPLDQFPTTAGFTMSTLAANTGLIQNNQSNIQNYKAVSVHECWSIVGLTADDGPFLFGIQDGELTLAELTEYLTAAPTDRRDTPQGEQVQRPVQVLGSLGFRLETVYVKERVILPTFFENRGFTHWIFNLGVTMTTGATARANGRFFGRWLD